MNAAAPTRRSVRLPQGVVEYWELGVADAPPVVFVHGVLANGRLWEGVAAALADRYRCIVPDWPLGAHATPMSADADLSPPGVVALIVAFLDALGIDRATFVGNDSGGALCQMLVTTHPERVHRLVLTSSDAYGIWLPWLFKYLEFAAFVPGMLLILGQTMRLRLLRRLPIAFGWLAKRLPADVSDAFAGPVARSAGIRRDAAKFLRGISPRHTRRAATRFGDVKVPVLVAWSRDDRFFPLAHAERLRRELPDAELVLIDDAYTFSPIDRPDAVADAIGGFLARRG